jgi:hypothetical protein
MTLHQLLRWAAAAILVTCLAILLRQLLAPWTTQALLEREVPAVAAAIQRDLRPLAEQQDQLEAQALDAHAPAPPGSPPPPKTVFTAELRERSWNQARDRMLRTGAAAGEVDRCLARVRSEIAASDFWSREYMVPVYIHRARVIPTPVWVIGFSWGSGTLPGGWMEPPTHYRVIVVELRRPYRVLDGTNCM